MLTLTNLFRFAKRRLGSPFVEFELTDDELKEILEDSTMPTFNRYLPNTNNICLDASDVNTQTGIPNEFWLRDPDNLRVMSVSKVLIQQTDMILHAYPVDVAFRQFDELPEWALAVDRAETAYLHSPHRMMFFFLPPSKIRITPVAHTPGNFYTVEYQREHKIDLSTIQNQYEQYLKKLFLADVKVEIGNIRRKYQSLPTPFGEINLNGEALVSEGREDRAAVETEFEEKVHPNVIIRVG